MQKIYYYLLIAFCFTTLFTSNALAQSCSLLSATFKAYESRCAATGSIKIFATGGSGSYKYKTIGPVNSNFTTADSITGLSSGVYSVVVTDIATNCTFTQNNISVIGSYLDPRFTLSKTDISCDNGNNGSITVSSTQDGRDPFAYTIVSPSAMGVGTSNNTGTFNNLIAGDYTIMMSDSCGGIQTRQTTLNDYSWWINSYVFNKISCDSATGYIKAVDSRGNISNVSGIPGFTYGVVRQPGDTVWSASANFSVYIAGLSNFDIVVKDNCGKIKKGNTSILLAPALGAGVNIYGLTCDRFSVSLININNFFNADFCLYDNSNTIVVCNTTGTFTNLPYGSYCIKAHDNCTDTVITRCFTTFPPPLSIGNNVAISNKNCSTFSAAITGQNGTYNPSYCLYDSTNTLLSCNMSGVFNNLPYANYCIEMKDGCRDTTITRCFTAYKPRPSVDQVIVPSYISCNTFGIVVNGDSLTSPSYCLYDSLGAVVACNATGIFDSLSLGSYCVNVYDACFDTTFIRCFSAGLPIITNNISIAYSNKGCASFTATASGNNLTNPYYCLYNSVDSLISCDSTGIFDNLPYGSYCIKTKNACPDTTFINCFALTPPIPSVKNNVQLNNYTCTDFRASITNQQNLTAPQFCLYDNNNQLVSCNSTGVFSNLQYGSYCIKITNTCYDTVITRCFTAAALPVNLSVTSAKSCAYGYAKFSVTVNAVGLPVNLKVYDPNGNLFFNNNYSVSGITIDSIAGTVAGQTYKIIATDNCGKKDSINVGATASYFNHAASVVAKCPGGSWPNGSGSLNATVSTNMGSVTVRVIKKDATTLSPQLVPNSVSGGVYTFDDLGPATYILSYSANDGCNRYLYDTAIVNPYVFPNLNRSSAYQCDVNGFSVGAVASDGVGPFSYSIIGSSPSSPSIMSSPQANPIFTINNGTNYSLIRLRALDACGNATLADASILPLASNRISSTSNCFGQPTNLTVDALYNSTYEWYKKDTLNGKDSILVGTGNNYLYIPAILPSDTGYYICHLSVLNGCVNRSYYYNLTGTCYAVLPITSLNFSGSVANNQVLLNWNPVKENSLAWYIIERKNPDNTFTEIGRVHPAMGANYKEPYYFIDKNAMAGNNFYRLKLVNADNSSTYSDNINIILRTQTTQSINIYPNPVTDLLTIEFKNPCNHVYRISLVNLLNQVISEKKINTSLNKRIEIKRSKAISSGIYIVHCIDLTNNEDYSQKVIFR
ncbi:MAG: T9SS type A sorting domain-containing protein [Bacteroidota bacterium]|nr:T9SS type A sorting domain-containing protein [Bacteroidota bacterium]